jgi:hypothetical protein
MNKPGKIIILLFVFSAFIAGPLSAQGYPVIDIANLCTAHAELAVFQASI